MKILVAGELNVDLVLQNYHQFPALGREVLVDDVSLTIGSASAICAGGLARLGNSVTFVGVAGTDAWGDLCEQSLKEMGVDCSLIMRDAAIKTGITVSITSAKDRALVTYPGSIAALKAGMIHEEQLHPFQHLHVSSFFLQTGLRPDVRSLLGTAHRNGLTTSLDPGFDPADEWGNDLIDALYEVDVFFPNEVELERVTAKADYAEALRVLQNGRTLTIAKLGKDGCAALLNGELVRVPAYPIQPIDTTGAGDSFNAGFLHYWLRKRPIIDAMRFGAACGAISTQGIGGTTGQASEAEASAFLEKHGWS